MTARFGPRFGAESAFIIAAAVLAYLLQFSLLGVAAVVFGAWLAVAVFEVFVARTTPAPRAEGDATRRPGRMAPPPPAPPAPVEAAAAPPRAPLLPWPETSSPAAALPPAGPTVTDEPRAEPPAPPAEPEPEPESLRVPEPEPPPAPPAPIRPPAEPEAARPVLPSPAAATPAQRTPEGGWNLWELERVAREQAGHDPVRDEERSFLLMYLREFADAEGNLAPHFDSLVRDSFPDLTGSVQ